ncbi:MAG: class I SAM-dependent methyltransferase [Chthoniobacteraceae bacterium]|nr:class I SAM-dependent methyltransferase [Chthoniobacteraceae bacterium]
MKPKISLCLIVGNVEEYIERCLSSFLPIADEVILVRAIGNQKPDRTFEIARKLFPSLPPAPFPLCPSAKEKEKRGKGAEERNVPLITAEYSNSPSAADWPHVDNFAAARQLSFDLATGDYCFWADTDDILEGGEHVRELADRGGFVAYLFPYNIFGRGVHILRERMILRGSGQWLYPVHECFDFKIQPAQSIEDRRVVVTHLPHQTKTGSNERNLRILRSIPDADMTPGLLYHLQGELAGAGDIPGSIVAAQKALASPDLGRPERFELFMNLARLSTDPATKTSLLHQAYQTDPRRREALGLLTCSSLDYGRNSDALAYARQMMSTLPPANADWNERAAAYGWLGDDIYSQALRGNGLMREAEIVRQESLKRAGGPRIALLHATRGRPLKASQTRKLWLDLAERPDQVEHIFAFDQDDTESAILTRMHHTIVPTGGGCVAAWNQAAWATTAPILVQLSDDWTPTPFWDKLILERLAASVSSDPSVPKGEVLAISDGFRTDHLLCMAICTREYLMHDGFLFHPFFTGVYSDNWFTQEAYARKAVIEARDIVFTHDHFLKTGEDPDATYAAQNAPARYADGAKTIADLRAGNDWTSIPGFFNYISLYQTVAAGLRDGDTICEVGVWLGRSIIFLAQLLKRQGKRVTLLAVDHFTGELNQPAHTEVVSAHGGNFRAEFESNLQRCGVADMVRILDGDSAAMAAQVPDGTLAFCFIDAAHDYASVKKDLVAWQPKLKANGLFAGHDAQHEEVMRAVDETFPAKNLGCIWVKEVSSLESGVSRRDSAGGRRPGL